MYIAGSVIYTKGAEEVKTLSWTPYIDNLARHFNATPEINSGTSVGSPQYREWLSTHGFKVPVERMILEFDDTFTDQDLTAFVLKWG